MLFSLLSFELKIRNHFVYFKVGLKIRNHFLFARRRTLARRRTDARCCYDDY